ncbi:MULTISPECIES: glycosyltransferase [unclassified Rhizobium]|uniref:glycosyltransferase n=1 Tax=unclassified Rhizobium TaxID=2613769 RepID=UPI001160BEDB|nr:MULTISPECIES: glycosyltransferase [unclassified Rhizobium]TQX86907.1 glycosyltransferase [Rhizobium sp. rho-13.1]TQY08686.1 glycosyltransferase [Rhizobium sp. rho-1.1]
MRILIDMQGAQSSGSRNRGIGRYTQSLVRSLFLNKENDDEIILLFSSAFWECIPDVLAEMNLDLRQDQVRVWHCNSDVSALDGTPSARIAAELSREAYISSLAPDVILITSIFEGSGDDFVLSIDRFYENIPTGLILYDLIPYLYRSLYLSNAEMESWYERKLQEVRKADVLLAISECSRKDALNCLGFGDEEVVNISSAAEGFCKKNIDADTEALLRGKYDIRGDFVLYTGGIDHRKNVEGLIEAFADLPSEVLMKTQLVIVCSVHQFIRERLTSLASSKGLRSGSVILTGFVSEDDLVHLYNLCDLFVFPSLYEGFGLPVLEAMQCGAVVIGANTSSIPEVIGFEPALFDASNKQAIVSKIVMGLTDKAFREAFKDHALQQVKRFSWDESGRRTLTALRNVFESRRSSIVSRPLGKSARLRMAYLSPLPPMKSGIADFSAELLPELARFYDIDLVVEGVTDFTWANANARLITSDTFYKCSHEYDRILYNFGNSDFHSHMFDLALEVPGVAVMHDFFLSGIHDFMQIRGLRKNSLVDEVFESHSYPGLHYLEAHSVDELVERYPCNFSVFSSALGVITHSDFSVSLGAKYFGSSLPATWNTAPLARSAVPPGNRELAREKLGVAAGELLLCCFGIVFPTKSNHRLVKAWARLQDVISQPVNLVFVGAWSGAYGMNIDNELRKNSNNGIGRITGWVDQETYRDYLAAADIAVQLRGISRGETSASVLDCMAAGLPTVVNANGSMAELPSGTVVMVSDDFTDDELLNALLGLIESPDYRTDLGRDARRHIQTHHSPRQVAVRYRDIIESVYESPLNLPHRLGRAIARDAPSLTEANVLSLAQASARNFRPQAWQRQILICPSHQQKVISSQQLKDALMTPYLGYRVDLVMTTPEGDLFYNRSKALALLGLRPDILSDEPIDLYDVDIIFTDEPDSAFKRMMITTPGVVVKPLTDLLTFLSSLSQVILS